MSTGVVLPYENAAMRADELPNGLSMPDQMMFINLREIYHQFHKGIIDRDRAVLEKKKLLNEYRIQKFWCDIWISAAKREQSIETIVSDILQDAELMQNDKVKRLISAIDGIRR